MVNFTLIVIGVILIVGVIILPDYIKHSSWYNPNVFNPTHYDYSMTKKLMIYSGFFGGIIFVFLGVFSGKL